MAFEECQHSLGERDAISRRTLAVGGTADVQMLGHVEDNFCRGCCDEAQAF